MKKIKFLKFIMVVYLFFANNQIFAYDVLNKVTCPEKISFKENCLEWSNRNSHLVPSEKEIEFILSLNQKRDFASSDIDFDGVINDRDPSPYDWREIGYQPFGVLEFLSWNHDWNNFKYSRKDLEKVVKLFKEAGIVFVRIDFLWQDIEPENNRFDFEKYDFIVDLLSRNNIKILGILGYSASWAGENWNRPPRKLEDFVEYVSQVISRYKDRIKYWEMWNEPDSTFYWQPQDGMKTYTKLLKECYLAAKKIDLSCKIVLGGMTAGGYYAIKNVYKNGGKDYFDIINIHPFVDPFIPKEFNRIIAIYNNLEQLKGKFNDVNKKIWFTEIGCPGMSPRAVSKGWWMGKSPSEKQQAQFLSSVYADVINLPNVEKIFWAYFRDNKEHFKNDVDYFGLIRWDFSKKPAFGVFKERYNCWLSSYAHSKAK